MEEGACEGRRAQDPLKSKCGPPLLFSPQQKIASFPEKTYLTKILQGEVTELKINDSNLNMLLPFGGVCKHSLPTSR